MSEERSKAKINVIFYRSVESKDEASEKMLALCKELQQAGFKPAGAELVHP